MTRPSPGSTFGDRQSRRGTVALIRDNVGIDRQNRSYEVMCHRIPGPHIQFIEKVGGVERLLEKEYRDVCRYLGIDPPLLD